MVHHKPVNYEKTTFAGRFCYTNRMDTKTHKNWLEYYDATRDMPPRPLLIQALESVTTGYKAIDIGGGTLRDARYLLSKGFAVTVIDKESQILDEAKRIKTDKLRCIVTTFEDFNFGTEQYDIASAMYSLPFNPPETFPTVFDNVKKSIEKNGIFTGQLFGVHDEWVGRKNMTFHTRRQVEELLADMEIILLDEEEQDGTTALGTTKHWHLFHVIAKKT